MVNLVVRKETTRVKRLNFIFYKETGAIDIYSASEMSTINKPKCQKYLLICMRNIPLHGYSLWQDTDPWERHTGTPPGTATCLLTPETVNLR
jgi:hypothetical protein